MTSRLEPNLMVPFDPAHPDARFILASCNAMYHAGVRATWRQPGWVGFAEILSAGGVADLLGGTVGWLNGDPYDARQPDQKRIYALCEQIIGRENRVRLTRGRRR